MKFFSQILPGPVMTPAKFQDRTGKIEFSRNFQKFFREKSTEFCVFKGKNQRKLAFHQQLNSFRHNRFRGSKQ